MILKKVFIIILSPFVRNCQASINDNMTQQNYSTVRIKLHSAHRYKKRRNYHWLPIYWKGAPKKVISWKLLKYSNRSEKASFLNVAKILFITNNPTYFLIRTLNLSSISYPHLLQVNFAQLTELGMGHVSMLQNVTVYTRFIISVLFTYSYGERIRNTLCALR